MSNEVNLTIDGKPVTVPKGTLVVNAAKMVDVDIPVFCYHPKMEPVGMCRMCLVEVGRPAFDRQTRQPVLNEDGSPVINFGPKLETGCTISVEEGMVIRGYTEKVQKGRQDIVEFILTSHPLDCPVCDKGGECPLQNLTMSHGPGDSRFILDQKMKLDKHVPLGDLIYLDQERCIQCARCIRFQGEIVDDPVLEFYNRGRRTDIVTRSDPGFDSYWSGNTSDICPVGALTTADFRFGARPWELNNAASICTQCPVGCNITFNTRREAKSGGEFVIKRVMPRQNESVNEIWICDKGRFSGYQYTEADNRITEPMIRKDGKLVPASWGEALDLVADHFGDGVVTLASGRLSNEDLFNLKALADHKGGQALLYADMAGGDLVAQAGLGKGSNLANLGKGDAILVVASDLEEEAPIWWLRVKQAAERGATLIVANPRTTKTDRAAAHKIRYTYGEEAATVTELVKGSSSAAKAFAEAENAVVFFGSEGTSLESSRNLAQACANLLIETGHVGKTNNGLVGVWQRANDQGAWDMGFRPSADLKAELSGAATAYVVAADPAGDDPALADALGKAKFVVVQDIALTTTAELADVVLPAQAFVSRDGSYTSGERRVQRFYGAVAGKAGVRPDYTIAAQIALRLDLELEGRFAGRVFVNIASAIADYKDLNFVALAQTEVQWPIVGREDMYYGGTTYQNSQGLGVPLPNAAERGQELKAVPVKTDAAKAKGLTAVPVTRLYDWGTEMQHSATLSSRLIQPHVVLHPEDAQANGLSAGSEVEVELNGLTKIVAVELDGSMPKGFVRVPRSIGLPISGPAAVNLKAAARELA